MTQAACLSPHAPSPWRPLPAPPVPSPPGLRLLSSLPGLSSPRSLQLPTQAPSHKHFGDVCVWDGVGMGVEAGEEVGGWLLAWRSSAWAPVGFGGLGSLITHLGDFASSRQ